MLISVAQPVFCARFRSDPICKTGSRCFCLANPQRRRPEQPTVVIHEFPIGEDHADVRIAI
jgi:hypothetical protein